MIEHGTGGRGDVYVSQEVPPQLQASYQLHHRLEMSGAYERLEQLDPRRSILLRTYLTSDKPVKDIAAELGIGNSTAKFMVHTSMEVAFFTLPEEQRAEYDNSPLTALQVRSTVQTKTKSDRVTAKNIQRWQRHRTSQGASNDLTEPLSTEETLQSSHHLPYRTPDDTTNRAS